MSPSDDRIPWITWFCGAAALLVLAATVGVLLSPPRREARLPALEPNGAAPAAGSAALEVQKAPTAPQRQPLDISAVLMDARARAALFADSAALISVRLIIAQGRPTDPIDITYAVAQGRPLPGNPVSPKRLRISYTAGAATEVKETDRSPARVLPDPNCPLEAAFRAAQQSGAPGDARYFAVYAHSVRHKRPTWTLSAGDGSTYHVDADNCALLVR